jgi:hypothetical protein
MKSADTSLAHIEGYFDSHGFFWSAIPVAEDIKIAKDPG